jgi:hypothetical protein
MSASAPARGWRWPIVVVIVVALVAGLVAQHRRDDQPAAAAPVDVTRLMPTATRAGLSSTWYCAAGSATGSRTGIAEQTVVIQNAGTRALSGTVTAMTDDGKSATKHVHVGGHDQVQVQVAKLVKASYAAALIEMDGGQVAVSHMLDGPSGRAIASCSSSPSSNWYLPSGTTRPGTRQLLALFNPFPSDAVATITFATDAGVRSPNQWNPVVVPSGTVQVLDVTPVVTLRTQIATSIAVRDGRLVVDQLQTADGTAGTAKGLAVTPAAPSGSPNWWFPDGPATPGASTSFVVFNPGGNTVQVALHIRLDQASKNGTVSPFTASVAPGGYSVIDLSKDTRVPLGVGYTADAVAADGAPIVVDRVVNAPPPAKPSGFDVTLGSPLTSNRWLVALASSDAVDTGTLIVTNLSATKGVQVRVTTVTSGRQETLQGLDAVERLGPGGRGGFTVPAGASAPLLSIVVDASAPVVVEERLTFPTSGVSSPLAVPTVG